MCRVLSYLFIFFSFYPFSFATATNDLSLCSKALRRAFDERSVNPFPDVKNTTEGDSTEVEILPDAYATLTRSKFSSTAFDRIPIVSDPYIQGQGYLHGEILQWFVDDQSEKIRDWVTNAIIASFQIGILEKTGQNDPQFFHEEIAQYWHELKALVEEGLERFEYHKITRFNHSHQFLVCVSNIGSYFPQMDVFASMTQDGKILFAIKRAERHLELVDYLDLFVKRFKSKPLPIVRHIPAVVFSPYGEGKGLEFLNSIFAEFLKGSQKSSEILNWIRKVYTDHFVQFALIDLFKKSFESNGDLGKRIFQALLKYPRVDSKLIASVSDLGGFIGSFPGSMDQKSILIEDISQTILNNLSRPKTERLSASVTLTLFYSPQILVRLTTLWTFEYLLLENGEIKIDEINMTGNHFNSSHPQADLLLTVEPYFHPQRPLPTQEEVDQVSRNFINVLNRLELNPEFEWNTRKRFDPTLSVSLKPIFLNPSQ